MVATRTRQSENGTPAAVRILPVMLTRTSLTRKYQKWDYSRQPSETLHVPQVSAFCPPEPPIRSKATPPLFPTPMYEVLHTNIPRSLMEFSDLPFKSDSLIFPSREDVLEYIRAYAESVRHLIRFSTQVKEVVLRDESGRDRWELTAESLVTGDSDSVVYDAVVVASGHYATVNIPEIRRIAEFHEAHPGVISHSKSYRSAADFTGKKVLIVGNGISGLDIAAQISRVCREPLLLAARKPTPQPSLDHTRAEEVPEVDEFLPSERGVRFTDGRVEKDLDAIIFATGYLFTFPFLADFKPPLVTDGRRVYGLYRDLFHIDHPSLVFSALPIRVVPFAVAESQAALFAGVWANKLPLPCTEDMKQWEKDAAETRGENFHVYPPLGDAEFVNEIHDLVLESKASGKMPPRWSDELVWQRRNYSEAKLRFEVQGRTARSLEELGFVYEPSQASVQES